MTAGDRGKGADLGPVAGPVGVPLGERLAVYLLFFVSGTTALAFEVLWSRQFVTVFGNSSYAISVVLCAFMAGLGVGGLVGGHLADRSPRRLVLYGAVQAAVAFWALAIPILLSVLRRWVPVVGLLAPESLLLASVARFVLSFGVLFVPCLLMGTSLPLLARHCAETRAVIGGRVGLLYGLNTLGATLGCFAAGVWMLDTIGIAATNRVAVGANLTVAVVVMVLEVSGRRGRGRPAAGAAVSRDSLPNAGSASARLLAAVAFTSGMASLCCEVLWIRYLCFLSNIAYTFTVILGIYLLGVGAGSIVYRALLARLPRPLCTLAVVELLLGLAVPLFFLGSALSYISVEPGALTLWSTTGLALLVPTMLMGMAFPLICGLSARSMSSAGRSVGVVYALNTAGSVAGSLLPVFVLIPWIGIQSSVLLMGLVYAGMGVALLRACGMKGSLLRPATAGAAAVMLAAAFVLLVPRQLCGRVLLATSRELGRHSEVVFYREGRTGTAAIVRDKVSGIKSVFINGMGEVPDSYSSMACFKLIGAIGPLLHPDPTEVLMVAFGGGVAGGTATQFPQIRSLEVVDLESSVVEAARTLAEQNNDLINDPKVRVVVDDGRNYIMMSTRTWPLIVCDSTHPKSSDSWVLYTREFYETLRGRLDPDGVVVQWLPFHKLSIAEYRIIVRTFQSVFPHASVWFSHGYEETGDYIGYTVLVATPEPLSIDLQVLRAKLAAPEVTRDLSPYGLHTPIGILEGFMCTGDRLREWVGQGPANTDDMPYTQYTTRYSGGEACTLDALSVFMESVWPYLRNVGAEADEFRRALDVHAYANRLVFRGRLDLASRLLPDDPKLARCRECVSLARQYIPAVAAYYPHDPSALTALAGRALSQPSGSADAVALSRRALALAPDDVGALRTLASAAAQAGRSEEAMAALRAVIALQPDAATHNELGLMLANAGRLSDAVAQYELALQADPGMVAALNNLGMAAARAGDLGRAAAFYEKALALRPDYEDAHNNMGLLLARRGRTEAAARHYTQAIQAAPRFAEAHNNLANLLAADGNLPEAVSHYERALRAQPDLVGVHINLAGALAMLGRHVRAEECLRRAICLAPDDPTPHRAMGTLRLQRGQSQEAAECFRVALRMDPSDIDARAGLQEAERAATSADPEP